MLSILLLSLLSISLLFILCSLLNSKNVNNFLLNLNQKDIIMNLKFNSIKDKIPLPGQHVLVIENSSSFGLASVSFEKVLVEYHWVYYEKGISTGRSETYGDSDNDFKVGDSVLKGMFSKTLEWLNSEDYLFWIYLEDLENTLITHTEGLI